MADFTSTIKSSGGDYTSLTGWESGEQTSIGSGDRYIAECYIFAGGLSDSILISGWSFADLTSRIIITVEASNRHDGTEHSGFYIVNDNNKDTIRWGSSNVDIEWIEIDGNGNNWDAIDWVSSGPSNTATLNNCILHDTGTGFALNCLHTNTLKSNNIIAYNVNRGCNIGTTISSTIKLIDWTIYNCDYGILRGIAKNCIVMGASTSAFLLTGTGSDYNYSNDATAPGANSEINKTLSDVDFVSTTGGSEDFHLQSTSDAIGIGIGPSSDSDIPTDDIDGDTRSGTTTDMGADLFVAVGGVANPWYYYAQQ